MSHIVTGGLGFIGTNLIRRLNTEGITDIAVIDRFTAEKYRNVMQLSVSSVIDPGNLTGIDYQQMRDTRPYILVQKRRRHLQIICQ